jgi:phosphoribosylanthranilate isomerase
LQVQPRCKTLAVDVSSGVEVSKGIKDAGKIHQFVAAVRAADAQLARSTHVPLPAT